MESARYPQVSLDKLPGIIDNQRRQAARLESEIPVLQEIMNRRWNKAEELAKLKQECKELQRKIDESLKETVPEHEPIPKAA